jgi:uncharacterized membrane protein
MIFLHGTIQFNLGYDYFNALISKIIFKNKKNYNFNTLPSLTSLNAYNMLATNTTNKINNQILTC